MLSLVDATPTELRAIADYYDDSDHAMDGLLDLSIVPVVEAGGGEPDKMLGFERVDTNITITDGDEGVGYVLKED